jgi:hypothetical protein
MIASHWYSKFDFPIEKTHISLQSTNLEFLPWIPPQSFPSSFNTKPSGPENRTICWVVHTCAHPS